MPHGLCCVLSCSRTLEGLPLLSQVRKFPAQKKFLLLTHLTHYYPETLEELNTVLKAFSLPALTTHLPYEIVVLSIRKYLIFLSTPSLLKKCQMRGHHLFLQEMTSFQKLLTDLNDYPKYFLFLKISYWFVFTLSVISLFIFPVTLPVVWLLVDLLKFIDIKLQFFRQNAFDKLLKLTQDTPTSEVLKKIDALYNTHFWSDNQRVTKNRWIRLKKFVCLITPSFPSSHLIRMTKKLSLALNTPLTPLRCKKGYLENPCLGIDANNLKLYEAMMYALAVGLSEPIFGNSYLKRLKQKTDKLYAIFLPMVYALTSTKREIRAKQQSIRWVFANLPSLYPKQNVPYVERNCARIIVDYLGL